MLELKGRYAHAKVFTDDLEATAISQIKTLLDQPFMQDTHPRFMPDAHAGKGCVIGTTMIVSDEICPNLVGVDIACGVLVVALGRAEIDVKRLDRIIHREIPAGFRTHRDEFSSLLSRERFGFAVEDLRVYSELSHKVKERAKQSYGTLGGGNHFIELARSDQSGQLFLVIHSGSRHLGHQIAEHYQKLAQSRQRLRPGFKDRPKDLATLHRIHDDRHFENYLHDSDVARSYARANRILMAETILQHFFEAEYEFQPDGKIFKDGLPDDISWFETVHNYIDQRDKQAIILRKGAISAREGEKVIIPLNMRDGSLIALGKGNPDWNYSGPHGAGRIMSRSEARKKLRLSDYERSMEGIYTTTANQATIDEAPFAYKEAQAIKESISETLEIIDHIKPIYNFKAK